MIWTRIIHHVLLPWQFQKLVYQWVVNGDFYSMNFYLEVAAKRPKERNAYCFAFKTIFQNNTALFSSFYVADPTTSLFF